MPTLMAVNIAFGIEEAAASWISARLFRLTEYLGTRQKFSTNQVKMLSEDIATRWSFLDLGEIDDFLYRLKLGEFGRFYGSDDPQLVMIALRQYVDNIRQHEIITEEAARRSREEAEHADELVSWEQFCKEKGLNPGKSVTEVVCEGMGISVNIKRKTAPKF